MPDEVTKTKRFNNFSDKKVGEPSFVYAIPPPTGSVGRMNEIIEVNHLVPGM